MAKRSAASRPCACSSGRPYKACCQPYHRGDEPPDAERLMRSRFAAFAMGDGRYLWRTLHPDHPLRARPQREVVRELSRAKQRLRYRALAVHDAAQDGDRARVLFTATVFERGQDRSFGELSSFVRVDGGWRYLDGITRPGPVPEPLRSVGAFDTAAHETATGSAQGS